MRRVLTFILAFLVIGLWYLPASATEGIYAIGFSAKSAGMGGASMGSTDDALAQITNPANLSDISTRFDFNLYYLHSSIHLTQNTPRTFSPIVGGGTYQINKDFDTSSFQDNNFLIPMMAYVQPLKGTPLTLGVAFYGFGGDASRVRLPSRLYTDELYRANLKIGAIQPALSYKVNDQLSVGAALELTMGALAFSQPTAFDTLTYMRGSSPLLGGFGLTNFGQFFAAIGITEALALGRLSDADVAFGAQVKPALTYKPSKDVRIGVSYQPKRSLSFNNGKVSFDFNQQFNEAGFLILTSANPGAAMFNGGLTAFFDPVAAGGNGNGVLNDFELNNAFIAMGMDPALGFRGVYDADVPFALPQQVDIGLSYKATPELTLAFDYSWIDWPQTFSAFRVKLSNGDNPNLNLLTGGSSFEFQWPIDWKEQHVFKFGGAYTFAKEFTGRAGISYATNPIRAEGLVLTFPAYGFTSVSVGGTYKWNKHWEISAAYEHAFKETVTTSTSTIDQAQNSNASESHYQNSLYVQVSYIW